MAIVNCEECGKEISDKAVTCPYCGAPTGNIQQSNTKFCKHCGESIDKECIICPKCGKQVEEIKNSKDDRNIVINNTATANSRAVVKNVGYGRPKNKWVAFLLCVFLGFFGAHKFYEGKMLLGIVYLFTAGLFGIGWFIDIIVLLFKPNPYYV